MRQHGGVAVSYRRASSLGSSFPSISEIDGKISYRATPFTRGRPVDHRLVVLDRMRGVALIGVAVVNLMVFAGDAGAGIPDYYYEHWISWLRLILLNGKLYPVMAALFGYSIGLQINRPGNVHQHRRSAKRRLFAIGVIGLVHALLLYRFDILLSYSILGMCAYWMRNTRWTTLAGTAAALLVFGNLLFVAADINTTRLAVVDPLQAIQRYAHGSYIDVVMVHVQNFAANFAHVILSQWTDVLAMMLLGLLAERVDFARRATQATRRIFIGLGLCACVLTMILDRMVATNSVLFATEMLAPVISLGIVGAVLSSSANDPRWRPIDAMGQMSLSCYLLQSVIFNLTLYGFGFNLSSHFRPSIQLLFVFAVIRLEMRFSYWYLNQYERGPAERLLHLWITRRTEIASLRETPAAS